MRSRTELFRALKLAKGFERQRLAKRLRDETNTPQKTQRLEREVLVLKSLDLQQAAQAHLVSSLLKVKAVAEAPGLPEEIRRGVPKPDLEEDERAALHNVTSALYNRSQIRDVVTKAVADICASLGVSPPGQQKGKRSRGQAMVPEREQKEEQPADTKSPVDIEDEDDVQLGEDVPAIDDISDDDEAEAAIARFGARLASSSDEESGSESESDADSEDGLRVPRTRQKKAKGPTARPSSSTFLPSLTAGYISGGSESASDIDDGAPRKNRRGQRARQKIWELKYREQAKHVKAQKESRDYGWDAKLGAVEEGEGGPWKKGVRRPLQKTTHDRKPEEQRAGPKKFQEKPEDLHPSWAASRRAKEKQETAAYQGKKVVFD